jgi:Rho guanine nucleotide exchange factor 2
VTIRSVHRPFEDRERQELGSPDERLQDSSDPDTGSEEEGSSRLSPPHSPRGKTLAGLWSRGGPKPGYKP